MIGIVRVLRNGIIICPGIRPASPAYKSSHALESNAYLFVVYYLSFRVGILQVYYVVLKLGELDGLFNLQIIWLNVMSRGPLARCPIVKLTMRPGNSRKYLIRL